MPFKKLVADIPMLQTPASSAPSDPSSTGPRPTNVRIVTLTPPGETPRYATWQLKPLPQGDPQRLDRRVLELLAQSQRLYVMTEEIPADEIHPKTIRLFRDPVDNLTFCMYLPLDDAPCKIFLEKMIDAVAEVSDPASRNDLTAALAKCWLLCKRRSEEPEDVKLTFAAFLERLERYPSDATISSLETWPERNIWTPSWSELSQMCYYRSWRRKLTMTALQAAYDLHA